MKKLKTMQMFMSECKKQMNEKLESSWCIQYGITEGKLGDQVSALERRPKK